MHRGALWLLVAAFVPSIFAAPAAAQEWPQWGRNPQHTGAAAARAQPARRILADFTYEPFAATQSGEILAHYQAPLLDGGDVYMAVKTGTYSGYGRWETQIWNEERLHWERGSLAGKWRFASDWKPVPLDTVASGPGWEPVFHAVLAGRFLYLPGAGGSLFKLNKTTGAPLARIRPFGPDLDPETYAVGPLTADAAGNVYYDALRLDHTSGWSADIAGAWLVKVAPSGKARIVDYATLTPGAPSGSDRCLGTFSDSQLPWPPTPTAVPEGVPCGSQRPAVNAAPAVAPDGTIYTVSRAQFDDRTSYLIAVRPDLTLRWAASLRDRLHDGCNVVIPRTGTPGGCRAGSPDGVDPAQNRPGAGRVLDDASSSPVVLPDGAVLYGAFTRYNYAQGHLMKFSRDGEYLGDYPFGWDLTPAVWQHGGSYSIVLKENHYSGLGSYCDGPLCPFDRNASNPADPEAYYITQLTADLEPEWKYRNTETRSCTRQPDGTVTCVEDHPHGFEWCVNAAAVDAAGSVLANSEDGNLYAIAQGGSLRDHLFLRLAIGAAYTPLSIGREGRIYTQNAGHLFAVGK